MPAKFEKTGICPSCNEKIEEGDGHECENCGSIFCERCAEEIFKNGEDYSQCIVCNGLPIDDED